VALVTIIAFLLPWGLAIHAWVALEEHRRPSQDLQAAGIEYPKLWWFSDYVNPKWYDQDAGPALKRFRRVGIITMTGQALTFILAALYMLWRR